jgi:hypothetical protein
MRREQDLPGIAMVEALADVGADTVAPAMPWVKKVVLSTGWPQMSRKLPSVYCFLLGDST